MSGVLWDLFSGSAPYTDVFLRTLHPGYVGSLVWNLLAANLPVRSEPTIPRGQEVRREH